MARLGGLGFGVGSGIGGVVQAHVEVAGRALCSVVDLEVLARHDAVEESRNALLDLPSEYRSRGITLGCCHSRYGAISLCLAHRDSQVVMGDIEKMLAGQTRSIMSVTGYLARMAFAANLKIKNFFLDFLF